MKIKFILPALAEADGKFFRPIKYSLFPPLGLAQLAAYCDEDDELEIIDLHVEKADFNDEPDLVVIQTYITNAYRAYTIADSYRQRGIFVAIGGLHATSLPDETLLHADAVFTGPAHQIWGEFLKKFKHGKRPRGIFTDNCRTLDNLPFARRDLIKRNKYLVPNSIVASRGCPCQCDFCYTQNFFADGKSFYTAKVDRILAEIEMLKGRHLFFLDDNLFGSPEFAKMLFEGMRGMKRTFQAAATTTIIRHPELLDLAAEAGLKSLFIGFESLNQDSLASCNKKHNHTDFYPQVVSELRKRNIMTNASFVFGLANDRKDVFERTVEWAVERGIETATFHLATPYPGTPFYNKMQKEKRIITSNYELYDTRHAIIKHDFMSGEELENGYWQSYRNFYSYTNILKGALTKETFSSKLKHLLYSAAWKKADPLWHLLIKLKSLPCCSTILEKVLEL